jgi:predicted alpha/beta superfamily hydrolase
MMKNTTYFVLAFTIWCTGCNSLDEISPENIIEINSTHTGEKYMAHIVLPENYQPNQTYPVVYLLDGYFHFEDVRQIIHQNESLSEIILVSLSYADYPYSLVNLVQIEQLREIDFTYPANVSSKGTESGGGGLQFYDFLTAELIPEIDQRYSTDTSNRTIMGHSLGGYFCLFQMMQFRDNPTFQNVISLSPSLWWSDLHILEIEQNIRDQSLDIQAYLYVGIGLQEGVEGNVLVDELEARLTTNNHPGLSFSFERYKGGHFHSAKTGFESALKQVFP